MSNKILVQQITHCHANARNYPRKFNVIERRQNFSETDLQVETGSSLLHHLVWATLELYGQTEVQR